MFSLTGPSHLLFDFDFITLGFVIELIQHSYIEGLLIVMYASFILSILYPSLACFTLAAMGDFFPQDMCGPIFLRPHYPYSAYVSLCLWIAADNPTAALDGARRATERDLSSFPPLAPPCAFQCHQTGILKSNKLGLAPNQ